ncbi:hypothetical protein HZC53_04960 [Candidatus Uhrbacteria bacterium]|nr:hypothetical protein [Candidatus Uhrbacteria bacterium]
MTTFTKTISALAVLAFAACADRSQEGLDPDPVPQTDAAGDVQVEDADDAKDDTDKGLTAMCDFDGLHAGIAFKAPEPRGEGHLAYSASIDYPDMANKDDLVPGLNPFPGCVAAFAADQSLDCDFGAAFQGTKILFNVGLNDGSFTEPAGHYFSGITGDKIVTIGTVAACVGGKLVGFCKDDKCEGALAKDLTGNLAYTIPQS